jgi:hypothetical protein
LLAEGELRLGERVLEQGIVQGAEDKRPSKQRRTSEPHLDGVPQESAGISLREHLKPVLAVEAKRCCELKSDSLAGLIAGNGVADRPVAAKSTRLKRAIKAHAWPSF